jgi:hypothetical protein
LGDQPVAPTGCFFQNEILNCIFSSHKKWKDPILRSITAEVSDTGVMIIHRQENIFSLFVVMVTVACLAITNGTMVLNKYGMIAREEWIKSAEIRQEIRLHELVVMQIMFTGLLK